MSETNKRLVRNATKKSTVVSPDLVTPKASLKLLKKSQLQVEENLANLSKKETSSSNKRKLLSPQRNVTSDESISKKLKFDGIDSKKSKAAVVKKAVAKPKVGNKARQSSAMSTMLDDQQEADGDLNDGGDEELEDSDDDDDEEIGESVVHHIDEVDSNEDNDDDDEEDDPEGSHVMVDNSDGGEEEEDATTTEEQEPPPKQKNLAKSTNKAAAPLNRKQAAVFASATAAVTPNQMALSTSAPVKEDLAGKLARLLNLAPLEDFTPSVAFANQTSDTVTAHVRLCALGPNAFMVFILEHHYDLREALMFGKTYFRPDGTCGYFPSVCQYVSYVEIAAEFNLANIILIQDNLPKLTLPAKHGFKTYNQKGGIMVCSVVSRQQLMAVQVSLQDMYAKFVYAEDNPFFAGKKVVLDIKEFTPTEYDETAFRVVAKLCRDKATKNAK